MSSDRVKAVLEVGPLFESNWTGIPNVVAALAERAVEGAWARPTFADTPCFEVREGRHPVVEAALGSLGSHGLLGLVGVPPKPDSSLTINLAALITYGHRIHGIIEGDSDLDGFIPELVEL
ncbi:hypothetical protein LTR94_033283, partial [Friedmanniomyces endolithicus]